MAKTYLQRITLTGSKPFPVDMLRYDECMPASEADARMIERTIRHDAADFDKPVHVTVKRTRDSGQNINWTAGRWQSFGWTIDEASAVNDRIK